MAYRRSAFLRRSCVVSQPFSVVLRRSGCVSILCMLGIQVNDFRESEILLSLKKEEDREKIKSLEVGVSGRHYALVPEGLWLGSLKRLVTIFIFDRF
ncbi:hypothetical protein TSUD_352250 [Trifolium subterraneum]|nr:hypothetical protein TSUD_352250 [Trifolium subterraneum]